MSDPDDILNDARKKMKGAVSRTRQEFGKIRTGRANPQLLEDLPVEYYGTKVPLQQLAGISVPEARMLVISPFDQSAMKEIERAIIASDLGLNPNNDGQVIRVVFPELTEERRKDFVRHTREKAEEGRVSVRNIRRQAKQDLQRLADDGAASEDEVRRAESKLQDITDDHVGQIDELLTNKEQELLEV